MAVLVMAGGLLAYALALQQRLPAEEPVLIESDEPEPTGPDDLEPVPFIPPPGAVARAGRQYTTRPDISADGAIPIAPGESIQEHVDSHPEGTTFLLESGIHRAQAVGPRGANTFLGEPGTVLDGEGVVEYAFTGTARDVTIRGLLIENYVPPLNDGVIAAQPGGGGWRILDNEIRHNEGAGVYAGSEWVVAGNFLHHNGQFGVNASGRDILIEANEIVDNGVCRCNLHSEGGTKFVYTRRLVARGNQVYDNYGAGLWTDINNVDTLYEDNHVVGNSRAGVFVEISYDSVVRNNLVEQNGWGEGMVGGAGILVNTSSSVTIEENVVVGNRSGVVATHEDRSGASSVPNQGEWAVQELLVRANVIAMAQGQTGLVTNTDQPVFSEEWDNRFEANSYRLEPGDDSFVWGGERMDWEAWTAFGHDSGGSFEELTVER